MLQLAELQKSLHLSQQFQSSGRVVAIRGPIVQATLPHAALGDLCTISKRGGYSVPAQVVGFQEATVNLAPLGQIEGILNGANVKNSGRPLQIPIYQTSQGQILNAFGEPLKASQPTLSPQLWTDLIKPPPDPLERPSINTPLQTGIRVIDALCPIGYGQRVGLFAGAGLGKSTLLGSIARNAFVDLNVIALIGERGREVGDFIRDVLGPKGLEKSIVIVATSEQPAMLRALAGQTAMAIAEHYRQKSQRVLLLVDSLTRMARAIRDVGLAAGEIPVRQGYTATVYSELPRLLERAGNDHNGSITAVYTVLTNGDSDIDPLGEEIKSLLDGQIVLSNSVAQRGIRPAIDPGESISRLTGKLLHPQELRATQVIRRLISRVKSDKDLVLLGGRPDHELAAALQVEEDLQSFISQEASVSCPLNKTFDSMHALVSKFETVLKHLKTT